MPTIRDVANHAGVHASTVSRVLSGRATISPATRARVLESAHLLGWKPNALARSLSQGSTNTLGLVIPPTRADSLLDPFFPHFLQALLPTVQALGFRLLVVGAEQQDDLEPSFHLLHSRLADGMLVLTPPTLTGEMAERLRQAERPILLIGQPPDTCTGLSWVDADHAAGMREAVAHLLTLGHRRVALLGGAAEAPISQQRLAGYEAALASAMLPSDPALIRFTDGSRAAAALATHALLQAGATAICAASDLLALGVLDCLMPLRRRVPEELSIIGGFSSLLAEHLTPPLTTLRLPVTELAQESARLLVAWVEGRLVSPVTRLLPCSLVVRASTAPPPTG